MLKHRVVSVETSVEFLVYITDFEEHCRMVIADLSPHPIPTVCLQLSEDNLNYLQIIVKFQKILKTK